MNRQLSLAILSLGLFFCGCKDSAEITGEDWEKLDTIGEITAEIQQAHKIESHPYYRIAEDAGQIELHVADPEMDHQALATEISKLKSVQSFDGKLYLVYRHPADGSVAPTMWIKYDAKTGQQAQQ